MIKIKRVFEKPEKEDGYRVLVDRLWPRGIGKEKAAVDLWLKEIAPSNELRKWFSHKPEKWNSFQKKYAQELNEKKDLINKIREKEESSKVLTLLFAAKDEKHNNAVVLRSYLSKIGKK